MEDDLLQKVARVESEIVEIKKTASYQYQSLHKRLEIVEHKLLRWGGVGLLVTVLIERFM